jgi:hypothetical protein
MVARGLGSAVGPGVATFAGAAVAGAAMPHKRSSNKSVGAAKRLRKNVDACIGAYLLDELHWIIRDRRAAIQPGDCSISAQFTLACWMVAKENDCRID